MSAFIPTEPPADEGKDRATSVSDRTKPDPALEYSDMTYAQKLALMRQINIIRQMYVSSLRQTVNTEDYVLMYDFDARQPRTVSGLVLVMRAGMPFQLRTPWGAMSFPQFGESVVYVDSFMDNFILELMTILTEDSSTYERTVSLFAIIRLHDQTLPRVVLEDYALDTGPDLIQREQWFYDESVRLVNASRLR